MQKVPCRPDQQGRHCWTGQPPHRQPAALAIVKAGCERCSKPTMVLACEHLHHAAAAEVICRCLHAQRNAHPGVKRTSLAT